MFSFSASNKKIWSNLNPNLIALTPTACNRNIRLSIDLSINSTASFGFQSFSRSLEQGQTAINGYFIAFGNFNCCFDFL